MIKVDSELIEKFFKVEARKELTNLIEVEFSTIIYNLFHIDEENKYSTFTIKKRNGGVRVISAPNNTLKYVQSILKQIFLEIYPPKSCVYGYVKGQNILKNAQIHRNKKHLINIDLKNFFPSINFGRVRGLFQKSPFNFNNEIATFLAQICCYNNFLPQGAPTSPILSNFICRKMDNALLKICSTNKCNYTRYADDLTISTNLQFFPSKICKNRNLSKAIVNCIENNGFQINYEKLKFSEKNNRQEVTGIIVNKKTNVHRTYIRTVRSMLNAWEKYGLHAAGNEYFKKFHLKNFSPVNQGISFEKIITGRIGYIGFIKGHDDPIYKKLYDRIKKLVPDVKLSIITNSASKDDIPVILGEGKSDWKHLKAAYELFKKSGKFEDLQIQFQEFDDTFSISDSELLTICKGASKINHSQPIICIFDRDKKQIVDEVNDKVNYFKYWGGNIYSFALQAPPHRKFDKISIEHLYQDSELKTKDSHGRRLFTADEFNSIGKHKIEDLIYTQEKKLERGYPFIIDETVYDANLNNVALTKNEFALNILNKVENFNNFTFENFIPIFNYIQKIIKLSQRL